jgi:hypothetical protein
MHDTTFAIDVSLVGVTTIFGLVLLVNGFVAGSKEEKKDKAIDLNN